MALQKFAHGATHYCKFKRTALCENALLYDNKTTINKQILCKFQKIFFQTSKNWHTSSTFRCFALNQAQNKQILCKFQKIFFQTSKNWHTSSTFRCFALNQVDLLDETLPFSVVLPLQNTQNFIGCHFFHTHVFLKYCGKRSFLGVAKSWKVTLDRVPLVWAPC